MGRRIFRRTTLSSFLALWALCPPITPGEAPLPAVQLPTVRTSPARSAGRPARQGHAAPKSWSGDFAWAAANRGEIDYWIMKWASPEGTAKLISASDRLFIYRRAVDAIMRGANLPWELAAIPVVESNWRTAAVSSSGAVGPWQILEATGRGRGLVIDAWRDERRDIWKSTRAAAAELNFHYRLFGEWAMAAASYNAGPTRMRKIKESGGFSGFWDIYDAGLLPRETKNYVPQVIAAAYVLSHAGRLGLPIQWESPPRWAAVPAARAVHLGELSSALGIDYNLIRRGHGELHHPVTPPPEIPYLLKLPSGENQGSPEELLETIMAGAPKRFWRYTVRGGDTLSEIARRNEMPLKQLLRFNTHLDADLLRVGERIYIPGDDKPPAGADADTLPSWGGRYLVQSGDSLWSIARKFDVALQVLAEVNHRPVNGRLDAGSVIQVPGNGGKP